MADQQALEAELARGLIEIGEGKRTEREYAATLRLLERIGVIREDTRKRWTRRGKDVAEIKIYIQLVEALRVEGIERSTEYVWRVVGSDWLAYLPISPMSTPAAEYLQIVFEADRLRANGGRFPKEAAARPGRS